MESRSAIFKSVAAIKSSYDFADVAERTGLKAKQAVREAYAQVQKQTEDLSFHVPATIPEACIIAALLSSLIIDSTVDDEGKARDQIDRMLTNLVIGLKRQAEGFSLPAWLEPPI